ncbi:glycosyltransferase family 1 protein [Paenibacillus antri]|uniref:Glycosyltransferase family 1 protein n=1 Tax=Paenibacillus antri TaxID=2582848 RepID=A0A5R9G311_9BACL|nr:glycosyltransferase family 1 protein [Paenibacillus antri]TLS49399.1 glycosyltransferase family 1 protein [Paenibacillus antri]
MGSPVKVLHVVANMNRGGAETLIMNLYRNMDRSLVQFDFLTHREGVFDKEIRSLGGTVYRIPYINEVGHVAYLRGLDQFFRSHAAYKIVHSHMDKMSGFVLRAANRAGIPIRIAHSHNTSSEGGIAAKAYKWTAGRLVPYNATHLLACSELAAAWMYRSRAKHSSIVRNGIECERFRFDPALRSEVREELGILPEGFVVGHVGRFADQKNHSFLIDIFAEIVVLRPDARLLLLGDGPLCGEIKRKVADRGLERSVRFLGVRGDVHRILQAMDVMVFPSLHEGLPVTLVEAQGSGLPCIVSDRITREVDMGQGLVSFVSLRDHPRLWGEKALQSFQLSRSRGSSDSLKHKGYDIRESALWLQQFYDRQFNQNGVHSL